MRVALLALAAQFAAALPAGAQGNPQPAAQNPSPMTESTRRHARVPQYEADGIRVSISGVMSQPADVFLARSKVRSPRIDILVHFHGPAFIVNRAAERSRKPIAAVTVQIGAGSVVYSLAFSDPAVFASLLEKVCADLGRQTSRTYTAGKIILSAFSAGYGAVRQILGSEAAYARVDAVLLLDAIHAGYVPERRALADGGSLEGEDYAVFLRLARDASRDGARKRFLIAHSEVFPGTFASTTEVTDRLLAELGLIRKPVLRWGPGGMQQLSVAGRNGFRVLGFAGNTAPDHVDHLHGMEYFLRDLFRK
jgi:hypothetical protein